jgi:hypothetical protein
MNWNGDFLRAEWRNLAMLNYEVEPRPSSLAMVLLRKPSSAFLAEESGVTVSRGKKL